ncbi:plasmid pRiA4b ORF-3 family protein [Haliscomenobacter hydrossis]|uniref:Plasmid pRiA4b ORF-3 family protein n=1 Tax=Haliscomenobacter hydrossis (strain ATCC 27775 / DSM 1100 / LMG 10767 / O) TaxID=760192 RepID=F4L470_HALH1|nr:plasmid pRiA4b ORF-3 family protein [Haliscomenobacter hydrossis]AEE50768.1 plasmid pRiA4b ORF-3 family protein [Haliscomenobacter hydrossis DSM 1100]
MASLQLKVQLEGINPLIWRTFQIDQTETFFDLHEILQIVMGWENAHLFEFQIKERKIGLLPDEEEMWDTDANLEDSESIMLIDLNLQVGDTLRYIYDFGDHWGHLLTVEKITTEETDCPICLGGARNCPPEDCGGAPGYADFLDALKNPNHPQHEEIIDWIEEFDPEDFDMGETNEILQEFNDWRQDLFLEEE